MADVCGGLQGLVEPLPDYAAEVAGGSSGT